MEHNDGQRSLMGTNMQRQALPLVKSEAPIVGTGIEAIAARDSGHIIIAEEDGEIIKADSSEIHVAYKKGKIKNII